MRVFFVRFLFFLKSRNGCATNACGAIPGFAASICSTCFTLQQLQQAAGKAAYTATVLVLRAHKRISGTMPKVGDSTTKSTQGCQRLTVLALQ